MQSNHFFNILIIEDSEADQNMFSYLFENCPIPSKLHMVPDGEKGSDFVFKRGEFKDKPTPDLIILDLNLPIKNGREVLEEVRKDKHICHIPIIMITTSTSAADVKAAYCAGASAFIGKSMDIDSYQEKINALAEFWLKCAILPADI